MREGFKCTPKKSRKHRGKKQTQSAGGQPGVMIGGGKLKNVENEGGGDPGRAIVKEKREAGSKVAYFSRKLSGGRGIAESRNTSRTRKERHWGVYVRRLT